MNYQHNPKLTENAKELRKNMTKEEKHLWYDFLKGYPVRFLRQKIIDDYIADFYCHKARLVIELDGSQHYTKDGLLKDKIRTEHIEKRDLTVLRIPNGEINHNFEGICRFIDEFVKESLRHFLAEMPPNSCGAQNILRHNALNILTAAPNLARCFAHWARFASFAL